MGYHNAANNTHIYRRSLQGDHRLEILLIAEQARCYQSWLSHAAELQTVYRYPQESNGDGIQYTQTVCLCVLYVVMIQRVNSRSGKVMRL